MKYLLTKLINLLQTEEVRNYKIISSKYLQKGHKKRTVELFDLIRNSDHDEYSPQIVATLLEKGNKNAYYRIKNRLLRDLEHSLLIFYKDDDQEAIVLNHIRLSSILIGKSAYDEAIYYLNEAEKIAEKNEYYNLLNMIYDRLISLSNQVFDIDPSPYIKKKQALQEKYEHWQHTEQLLATISYRLRVTNYSSKEVETLDILEEVFEELKLSSSERNSPDFRLKINRCTRNILLQKREFKALSDYLRNSYHEFEQEQIFNRKNHEEKIIILIWLINALIKGKDIQEVRTYNKLLKENLQAYNNLYYLKYIWLYHQCKTVIDILDGQPHVAIKNLEALEMSPKYKNTISFFSVYLNLAMLYFYIGDLNKCLEQFSRVLVSSEFSSMPKSLQINIGIINLIFRVESKDYQYADGRYKELRRKFKKEFGLEEYKEQADFLDILKEFIRKPDAIWHVRVKKKITSFLALYSLFEFGSNETINYSIWLRARLEKRRYYKVMLEKYFEKEGQA